MRRQVLLALAAWLVGASMGGDTEAQDTAGIRMASQGLAGRRSGAGGSYTPSFSADGRFVVFTSHARDLTTNDRPSIHLNVFVHELASGQTKLVSANSSGLGGADGNANYPSISSNGQTIVFTSVAGNLAGLDTNSLSDVFVRDLASRTTHLVSENTNGMAPASSSGWPAAISADGRWIAFTSIAADLVRNDFNYHLPDVFLRDLWSNQTTLLSVNASCAIPGCRGSEYPSISADGRFVAFLSTGVTNLVPGVMNWLSEVYVRDQHTGETLWASTNVAGLLPGASTNLYSCYHPVISANGQAVAFKARLNGTAYLGLTFRYDVQERTTALISVPPDGGTPATSTNWQVLSQVANLPSVSADGRFVAYVDATNLFVWDAVLETNILASINRDGSGPANGYSRSPALSADGRCVAFVSTASDLVSPGPVGGLGQIYVRDLVAETTSLVSVNRDGLPSRRDHDWVQPAISPDGSLVAFDSQDDDLVADDLNGASDVFVRDLVAGTTRLISARHPGLGPSSARSLCTLANASCVSSNARWVVFTSLDSDLVPHDTNGMADIFVRDLVGGTCSMVDGGTNFSEQPVLSADGRYVAYLRWNVSVPFAPGSTCQVYRFDVLNGTSDLVSVRHDGAGPCSANATRPAISPDGRFVAFESMAADLVPWGTPPATNIFIRDLEMGSNLVVSVSLTGSYGNRHSANPTFSPDGRFVLYRSLANNLVTNALNLGSSYWLFARDLLTGRTILVSDGTSSQSPNQLGAWAISADSRWVAFMRGGVWVRDLVGGANAMLASTGLLGSTGLAIASGGRFIVSEQPWASSSARQLVLLDRQTGGTNLITVDRTGTKPGSGTSTFPSITPDGRFIVFASLANDLVHGDWNWPVGTYGFSDIFVHDRLEGITVLVSANAQGIAGTNASSKPVLAGDGRTVVFQSFAGDLLPGDYNETRDIFLLRLRGEDQDGDGLDDDWEMAYFSTLNRDGSGDFDDDGMSDHAEFRAGTDPTNSGSILRVMILKAVGSNNATLLWPAAPGRIYRAQYATNVTDVGWQDLSGTVNVAGGTASVVDSTATTEPRRFYRVVLRP